MTNIDRARKLLSDIEVVTIDIGVGLILAYANEIKQEADWRRKMSNWRLPTKDELTEMYEQLQLKGLGGFKADSYWSSSESGNNDAWYQNFDYGYQYANNKDYHLWVRLVRSLSDDKSNDGLVLSSDGQSFEVAEKDEPMMLWYEAMKKHGTNE